MKTSKTLPLLFALALTTPVFAAPDATTLLKKAEEIRNPQDDYSVKVVLKESDKKEEKTFKTMIKGRDKALVEFLTPKSDLGKKVLMSESNMWIYMPTSKKPIRVSPKQKLAGNAAYGDIARLNFIGNYTPKYIKQDQVGKTKAHVLELNAIKDRPVTYSKLEYWIDASNNRPIKVLFQTKNGKTMKTGYFTDYKNVLGTVRPTTMKILDQLRKGRHTTLKFIDAKKENLPGILFEKQNLGRS